MQTVVELPTYLKNAKDLKVSEAVLDRIKTIVGTTPSSGEIIEGTGGLRKIRIPGEHSGKSGSYRVITFFYNESFPVYLISIYKKNKKENLTDSEKNAMRKLTTTLIKTLRGNI